MATKPENSDGKVQGKEGKLSSHSLGLPPSIQRDPPAPWTDAQISADAKVSGADLKAAIQNAVSMWPFLLAPKFQKVDSQNGD